MIVDRWTVWDQMEVLLANLALVSELDIFGWLVTNKGDAHSCSCPCSCTIGLSNRHRWDILGQRSKLSE